eukprot:1159393-Pelagomonas_calceolata.AAC.5
MCTACSSWHCEGGNTTGEEGMKVWFPPCPLCLHTASAAWGFSAGNAVGRGFVGVGLGCVVCGPLRLCTAMRPGAAKVGFQG